MKNNKRIFITVNTEKILKEISKQTSLKLSTSVQNKSNKFGSISKIGKRKSNRYEVPLEFLELNDEMTQKIMCRILETIYKSYFFRPSFIFYPIFRTYNVLNYMERSGKTSKKYKIVQKNLTKLEEKKTKIISFSIQQTNYFRSFNDWVIGIKGEKFLIEKLRIEINHFLIIYLKQRVHSIKIKTIVLPHKRIKFVGYRMSFLKNQKINYCTQYSDTMDYQENLKKKFNIPIDFIFQKMKKEGYIKKLIPYYQSLGKINYTGSESMIIII